MHSFISPDNHLLVLLVVFGAATLGIFVEHKKWLGRVSGIIVTMVSMSLLSMSGLIPVASNPNVKVEVYDMVFGYFVPISIPLLLFGSNLMKIIRESGKLLVAYLIGAVGIVLGCFIAFFLIDLGDNSGNTAGVIAATLIGGSVNFIATAETLNFSTHPLFTATIAIDNFVANLYVLLLFFIPSLTFLARFFAPEKKESGVDLQKQISESKPISFERMALVLFIAVAIATTGKMIAPLLQTVFQTSLNLGILIITVLALLVANIFPKLMKQLEDTAFSIGLWMMYVFLAVIGAATNLHDILNIGPALLLFYLVIMVFHLLFVIGLSRLFKLNVYEVIVSSAANIMGPSVAAPMAASLGKKRMVTPGILVGILGYIIGTFVGVSIALLLN
ncbi:DUF819 family protein [Prolixibacteraceae bacterium JC049]|nr:DUF819 family protein [Prolixibacteraceae bacterium JC049]